MCTLLWQVFPLCYAMPFTSLIKLCENAGSIVKTIFAEPNQHVLSSLHPILIARVTYWALPELPLHVCCLEVNNEHVGGCHKYSKLFCRRFFFWVSSGLIVWSSLLPLFFDINWYICCWIWNLGNAFTRSILISIETFSILMENIRVDTVIIWVN